MNKKIIRMLSTILIAVNLSSCVNNSGDDMEKETSETTHPNVEIVTETNFNNIKDMPGVEIHPEAMVYDAYSELVIETSEMIAEKNREFRGVGISLTDEAAELLLHYKEGYAYEYEEILTLLFAKEGGVGFNHIKLPINSTVIKTASNFVVAQEALKINPDLSFELFYTGEERDYETRLSEISKIIEVFRNEGITISLISSTDGSNAEWIKHLSDAFSKMSSVTAKVAATDIDGSFSKKITVDSDLAEAVDVLISYNPNEILKEISEKNKIEIWGNYNAADYPQVDYKKPKVDMPWNIIKDIKYNNISKVIIENPINNNSDIPALINANNPEDGLVEIGVTIWQLANFSLFADNGYFPINTADNSTDSTFEFIPFKNASTGDYSIIFANNSNETAKYTSTIRGGESVNRLLYLWKTFGAIEEGMDYYDNYFQPIEDFVPVRFGLDKYYSELEHYESLEDESPELNKLSMPFSFSIDFEPLSVTAVSTKDIEDDGVYTWGIYSDLTSGF